MSYNFLPQDSENAKEVCTNRVKQHTTLSLKHRHVFLLGIENQVKLREYLQSNHLSIEVHDRDEVKKSVVKEEEKYVCLEEKVEVEEEVKDTKGKKGDTKKTAPPPPKKEEKKKAAPVKKGAGAGVNMDDIEKLPVKEYNKEELGCADFIMNSLLNPYALKFKLTQTIHPKKKYFDTERNNLDLNSNARKKAKDMIVCPLYMDNTSSVSIIVEISFPIGTWSPPAQESVVSDITDNSKLKKGAITKKKEEAPIPEETQEPVVEETCEDILRKTQTFALKPKA